MTEFWRNVGGIMQDCLTSALAAAIAGRLAWHTRLVQKGKRRFFSWALVWEAPTVYFTYLVGVGIADHFGWTGPTAGAVVAVISYFGPGGVQALLQTYASARGRIDRAV